MSIGIVALLAAGGVVVTSMLASPSPQPGPLGTAAPTVSAQATSTLVPQGSPVPAGTSFSRATEVPTADSGPADTPSADGPHLVTIEDSLTFGDQDPNTTSPAKSVTLSNEGGSAQPLGLPKIDGIYSGAFAVSNNLCNDSLDAVTRCEIDVTFTPGEKGNFSGTLEIDDPQGNTLASVTLSGTGGSSSPTSDIAITPSSVQFDAQGGITSYQSVNIDNNGSAAVTVSESLDDGGVFSLTGTCNGDVAAGTTCVESVGIQPPDQCDNASYSGSITFSDDAGNTLGSVSLSATVAGDTNQCPSTNSSNSRHSSIQARPRATSGRAAG